MRDQSQIRYILMNLILYSHLFTSVLFTNKKEKYVYNENISYLDKSKLDSFRKKFTRKKYRYIYFHEFNI